MTSRAHGSWAFTLVALVFAAGPLCYLEAQADGKADDDGKQVDVKPADPPPPRQVQPLAEGTTKALAYLVSQQHTSGGWGQGGGWRRNSQGNGRVDGGQVSDPPDLGNTCIATLALVRAGHTPTKGAYAQQVARAVAFICEQVEKSDNDSLYVTSLRDTQLQSKIGTYVDTFLAGLVLSELKGQLPSDAPDKRVLAALDKTVRKIEKNQQSDGTFAGNHGWAAVLSQGLASKFINRAAQNNVAVNVEVLKRDYLQTVAGLDKKTGEFAAAAPVAARGGGLSALGERYASAKPGTISARVPAASATPSDAGVKLYYSATNAGRLADFGATSIKDEARARQTLASKTSSREEKDKAQVELKRIDDVRGSQRAAASGIVKNLDDKNFVAGFGNNGGEEFLSYMNISEMLVAQGGVEWEKWNKSIAENLFRVQNGDGSWSGNHCITGRTFCTASALLTLMADRAPVPLAAKIKNPSAQDQMVEPKS